MMPSLLHDAALATTRTMQRSRVKRLLILSAAAHFPGIFNRIVSLILRNHMRDSLAMEEVVRASGLNWTIARPPRLTQEKYASYRSREDAAPEIQFGRWLPRTVVVNDGVARHEEQPALNLRRVAELVEPALKFHEHVVQDVFRRRWVGHPRANELTKPSGKLVPDLLNGRLHRITGFRQYLTLKPFPARIGLRFLCLHEVCSHSHHHA